MHAANSAELARSMTKPMRIAHLFWGTAALIFCAILLIGGGGHPPPVILLPVVLVFWAGGHVLLWGSAKLAARGLAQAGGTDAARWPPALTVALAGTGAAACIGVLQLAGSLISGKAYAFQGALWPITMTAWIVHGACFAGLLLRRPWSAKLAALLALGWGALTLLQMIDFLIKGRRIDMLELGVATVLAALLFAFGLYLLRSVRIASFFAYQDRVVQK